MSDVKLAQLSI